ncbi:MAG: M14 family metallopeptidase [Planctomycetota bacterium]|nr:M14 family metallopeptidase [Planctomycetota bacterium]
MIKNHDSLASFFLATCLMAFPLAGKADESHFQYLPKNLTVDPSIPTPRQHFGFRVGEKHLQHHQLVSYLRKLSKTSPRISLKVYAYTHGGRPCVLLTATSPANHQRLDDIRNNHQRLADPGLSSNVKTNNLPAVINMGYGVHGDESSASNASAVVAYYLAAAQGQKIEAILKNCVVLLDPCLNPDGFNRFASWTNGHVGRIQNPDPNHIEHVQPFPGGRVNYYWFDLNRDWLPAQHPESQGRLKQFHDWKPNVVLDFHEMGTGTTYFFQPGIPTRNNPLTPQQNYDLTRRMSRYHAKTLDQLGSLYMTEERFDDFYMGKGSTYPDLHGSIGILFEQASSRGHRQDSPNGVLTFPFTIRNQVATSLSSLDATVDLRQDLLRFKQTFYKDSIKQAEAHEYQQIEFFCDFDTSRLYAFAEVLLRHDLDVYQRESPRGISLIVPVKQPEFQFLKSLTEKRTHFKENIFYDVSTWHLPSAFGVKTQYQNTLSDLDRLKQLTLANFKDQPKPNTRLPKGLAYLVDWRSQAAPQVVAELLRNQIKIRVAKKSFSIKPDSNPINLPHGTIMVPLGIQQSRSQRIRNILNKSTAPVYTINTALTPKGIDLGSTQFSPVERPSVAMLIGNGVNRYEAGEVWHLFDTRIKMPLTLIDTSNISSTRLDKYNTLVLVSGSYTSLTPKTIDDIKHWINAGGNLVLCGSSITWANSQQLITVNLTPQKKHDRPGPTVENSVNQAGGFQRPFDQARNDAALKLISGAIFNTTVDRTHPLGYGFHSKTLAVFRNNKVILKPAANPYTNAVVYTEDPQIAGYCSPDNIQRLKNSAGALSLRSGAGTVMVIPQNPNFRAFWYGTSRLF